MKKSFFNILRKFIFAMCLSICFPFWIVFAEEDLTQYRTEKNKVDGEPYLNPEWIEWNNLTEEEKSKWEVIPSKLIYDYVYVEEEKFQLYNSKLIKSYNENLVKPYNNLFNYNGNIIVEALPSYYNLKDEELVGPVKNQSSLGLCWSFATMGTIESNARIKLKKELVFSERQQDYILSELEEGPIIENYNPYSNGKEFGGGGTFGYLTQSFMSGISPQLHSVWGDYTTDTNPQSFTKVLDIGRVSYQVTDTVNFPTLHVKTASLEEKEAYKNMLKEHIINYGGIYVSTVSPQGACYDSEYKIIKKDNCTGGAHAMLVVGWDDTYGPDYNGDGVGDGAWILKNSWGTSKTYIYLSYESQGSQFNGTVAVKEKNWDNNYDFLDLISKNSFQIDGKYYSEFTYYKDGENDELLNRITIKNWKYFPEGSSIGIYVSSTGNFEDKEFVGNININHTGIYSIDVDEILLNNDKYSFYIESTDVKFYDATAFTSDVNETSEIKAQSRILNDYLPATSQGGKVQLVTNTYNIDTGEQVSYNVKNSNNEDVNSLFAIDNTYVLNDNVSSTMTIKQTNFPNDEYILETYYAENLIDEYTFVVKDLLVESISFNIKELHMYIGSTYTLKTTITPVDAANSNLIWSSDNEEIASVNGEGVVTANNIGETYINVASADGSNITNKIKITVSDLQGSGTEEDPFLISDKYDLNFIRYNLNSHFKLTNNILFEEDDFEKMGEFFNDVRMWLPISDFEGVLDGNGYSIQYLTIYAVHGNNGLFGTLKNAKIINLSFEDLHIGRLSSDGGFSVGVVAGSSINSYFEKVKILNGTIGSLLDQGAYDGEFIESSENDILEPDSYVGGIVGLSENDTIINCMNNSNIAAKTNWYRMNAAGGIVGKIQNNTTIINSYNTGRIKSGFVGGIVGQVGLTEGSFGNAIILNSYNIGDIIEYANTYYPTYSGGIGGYIENSYIKNVYSIANYGEEDELDGHLIGYLENSVVENYYGYTDELNPVNSTLTNQISLEYISGALSNDGDYLICKDGIFDCKNVWQKKEENNYFTLKQNSINLNNEVIELRVNETKKIDTYYFNELGNYLNIENSNESVVVITSDGDILPKSVGSSTISFSSKKGSNIKKTFQVKVLEPLMIELTNNSLYVIKESDDNKYIDNILLNKTGGQIEPLLYNKLMSNFTNSTQQNFKLYNGNGTIVKDIEAKINTGMYFDTPAGKYIIVVRGDINGDGNITITDISKLYSHIKKTKIIEEDYYLLSGDSNQDSKITITDVSKLYSFIKNVDLNL